MSLPGIDLGIVVAYLVLSLAVGLYLSRRGGRSVEDYFIGGRNLPWWLAGASMIASSFAIDTPLGITGFVARHGIPGVWFAWAFAIGGAGTFGAFIFASLLRRSRVMTTAELIELRYSGRGAAVLRGVKAVYFGVLSLSISMGWVIRAVLVLTQEALGWDALPALALIITLTGAYTIVSGFWGVAITDLAQFVVGTIGSVALGYYALRYVGGTEGLQVGLEGRYGVAETLGRLHFIPRPGSEFFATFLVFVTLKWWGNPPAAIAQRVLAARNERHATFSQLLFSGLHFGFNYWPMIVAALVSLVLFPALPPTQAEYGYALLLFKVLPSGVLGLMLASLTAAFMSTVDTQANAGASFLINDIYRRFIRPEATCEHYLRASRVGTVIILALAIAAASLTPSVRAAWEYLATLIAGYNFVVVARWFWWRINAWSELAALLGSAFGSVLANHILRSSLPTFGQRYVLTAGVSAVAWVVTAALTKPSSMEHLARFCRQVRPYPLGWGPVRARYPDIPFSPRLGRSLALWAIGLGCVFCFCFGVGSWVFGESNRGAGLLLLSGLGVLLLLRYWRP